MSSSPVTRRVVVSRPDAAIKVTRIETTPEHKASMTAALQQSRNDR